MFRNNSYSVTVGKGQRRKEIEDRSKKMRKGSNGEQSGLMKGSNGGTVRALGTLVM